MKRSTSVLSTLIRMRWAAIVGQITVILVAYVGFSVVVLPGVLGVMLALEALSNVALYLWTRRHSEEQRLTPWVVFSVLAADIVFLTSLLAMTGGVSNPFALLYVVHVTLATVMMARRWAWVLSLIAVLSYASLFWVSEQLTRYDPRQVQLATQVMSMQREGMWVAFVVTSIFIVYFVNLTREQLAMRERELEQMNEIKRRQEHLASLATLTAGAAHELSTPLSTIALVARELEHSVQHYQRIEQPLEPEFLVEDAQLIRAEVARCQNILQHMSNEAGASMGEMVQVLRISTLFSEVLSEIKWAPEIDYEDKSEYHRLCVRVTPRAMNFALQSILRNAREAAIEQGRNVQISLSAKRHGDMVHLVIEDRSGGMSKEVLRRAKEPFFSTKETGKGMGLGLFLATTLCERLGGELEISEAFDGEGTCVRVILPHCRPEKAVLDQETEAPSPLLATSPTQDGDVSKASTGRHDAQ